MGFVLGLEVDVALLGLIQILARPIGLGAVCTEQRGALANIAHICFLFGSRTTFALWPSIVALVMSLALKVTVSSVRFLT